jgi:REP element-mobilizing transposase RayT
MPEFRRKHLPHDVPSWIDPTQEAYFITINCLPRGKNQLACPAVWKEILESIVFREQRGDWKWRIILAMPDHLHGIVCFPQRFHLRSEISHWKRWLAGSQGLHWQDGFFEHRLRNVDSAKEKANYIRMNPVRASLITEPTAWPYVRDWMNCR